MRSDAFWDWFADVKPKLGVRAGTFELMFQHLDKLERPVTIIETGCAMDRHEKESDNWGLDGRSTVLFEQYVRAVGGVVHTCDISSVATDRCKSITSSDYVIVHTQDSVKLLEKLATRTLRGFACDLLYLDSFDLNRADPMPSALHHLHELMAAAPMIEPHTLVVVDDSPVSVDTTLLPRPEVSGKGMLVAKYAELIGADMEFSVYQCGWTNMMPREYVDADDAIDVLIPRARAHVEAGRNVNADAVYRLILGKTTPPTSGKARVAHGEACLFYARIALSKSKFGAAADWYREAIQADPMALDYRLEMSIRCYLPMGAYTLAQQEAGRVTRIDPTFKEGWHVLGGVEHELGNAKACIEAYDRQLALDPNDPASMLDRATIALDVDDRKTAKDLCHKVIHTSVDRSADALGVLAMIAARESEHERAIEFYQQAIKEGARDPATLRWNMSLSMHAIGRYREAWIEHEHRKFQKFNAALSLPTRRFTLPMWSGEPPIMPDGSKARLHVHHEAGMGDNFAMMRYLPMLRDLGFDVRYETHDSMVELAARSIPGVSVIPKASDYPGALGIQMFDYHIPVGSLPAVLETDIDSVPWDGPYLRADQAKVRHYSNKMADIAGGAPVPRIGLCWSSGIREGIWISEYGRRKSMRLSAMMEIVNNIPGVYASLQVGPERAEQEEFSDGVDDLLPAKPTWDDTAAMICACDLVITVDTAVAHLAGALGKPVWVLMQRDGQSWHWMCWRPGASWNERSPWYPSARVFRQHEFNKPHVWDDVIDDVIAALEKQSYKVAV